jgi:hypothetical protein
LSGSGSCTRAVDVKFLDLVTQDGVRVRRFQYSAIDDATRVRALKIYPAHNQRTAIEFVDYVLERFPFRVRQLRFVGTFAA